MSQKLNLDKSISLTIMKEIGIIASWKEKEMDIDKIENLIFNVDQKILEQDQILSKKNNVLEKAKLLPKKKSSKKTLFLKILVLWMPLVKYTSEKQAIENTKYEEQCLKDLSAFQIEYYATTSRLKEELEKLKNELEIVKAKEYLVIDKCTNNFTNHEFENLRTAIGFSHPEIFKGIYVIWNKTKNKYYVGQSKDVYKRIFSQHFNKGDVKNIIFAKDWYNDDDFYYLCKECQTKDELDSMERDWIQLYNAFEEGYNSTNGNI